MDKAEHTIYPRSAENPKLDLLLLRWGLLVGQKNYKLIAGNLISMAQRSEPKPAHLESWVEADHSAVHLNAGDRVLSVHIDRIEENPVGHGSMPMISDDVVAYPPLDALKEAMARLKPTIGNACLRSVPGCPSSLLTTRWDLSGNLSPEQSQWFHLGRLLFEAFSSLYSLWPLTMYTGWEGSGKSTAPELWMALRSGRKRELHALPAKDRDFFAAVTSRSLSCFDNVDDVESPTLSNNLCLMSTGGEFSMARLYRTNEHVSYSAHRHVMATARVCPWGRSDVLRRYIVLQVAKPRGELSRVTKDEIRANLLGRRTDIWAELLLRYQNILLAHQAFGRKTYRYQSEMTDYERYTLLCSEYDGALPFAEEAWSKYISGYRETVRDESPVVHQIMLWLGADARNAGRAAQAGILHSEIMSVCIGVEIAHSSAALLEP